MFRFVKSLIAACALAGLAVAALALGVVRALHKRSAQAAQANAAANGRDADCGIALHKHAAGQGGGVLRIRRTGGLRRRRARAPRWRTGRR